MTTAKQKSVRDFRGRFKKKRYASPSEARQIFDRMYERGEREREAHLRTPEGERERQERNAATLARLRKNPRGRITPSDARDILAEMKAPGADFHALRSHDVAVLLDHAKHYHYRAPKGASGSKARSFYAYLERLAGKSAVLKNPSPSSIRKQFIIELLHKDYGLWYIGDGAKTTTKNRGLAKKFASEKEAATAMQEARDRFPANIRRNFVWMRTAVA
jgi:hypothetical protein